MSPAAALLAAFCAADPPGPPAYARARMADVALAVAVEGWVIDALPRGSAARGLDPRFGPRTARLLRGLGCARHECRELAAEAVASLGEGALPLLVWGTRSADPEVRHRSRCLFARLFGWVVCRRCDGRGRFPLPETPGVTWPCEECGTAYEGGGAGGWALALP